MGVFGLMLLVSHWSYGQYDTLFYDDFLPKQGPNGTLTWHIGDGPDVYDQDGIYQPDTTWSYFDTIYSSFTDTNMYGVMGIYGMAAYTQYPHQYVQDTLISPVMYTGDSIPLRLSVKLTYGVGTPDYDTLKIYAIVNGQYHLIYQVSQQHPGIFNYEGIYEGWLHFDNISPYLVKGQVNTLRVAFLFVSYWNGGGVGIDKVLLLKRSERDIAVEKVDLLPYQCSLDSVILRVRYRNVGLDTLEGFVYQYYWDSLWSGEDTVYQVIEPSEAGVLDIGPFLPPANGVKLKYGARLNGFNSTGRDSVYGNDTWMKEEAFYFYVVDSLNWYQETFDSMPAWNTTGKDSLLKGWWYVPDSGYRWLVVRRTHYLSPYYMNLISDAAPQNGDHTRYGTINGQLMWLHSKYRVGPWGGQEGEWVPGTTGEGVVLYSPWYDLRSTIAPRLSYWAYCYGQLPGTKLIAEAWDCVQDRWVPVDSVMGTLQSAITDPWVNKTGPLYFAYGKVTKLRFRLVTKGYPSDVYNTQYKYFVGIDDVEIREDTLPDLMIGGVYLDDSVCKDSSAVLQVFLRNGSALSLQDTVMIDWQFRRNFVVQRTGFDTLYLELNGYQDQDTFRITGLDLSSGGSYDFVISNILVKKGDVDPLNNKTFKRWAVVPLDSLSKGWRNVDFNVIPFQLVDIGLYLPGWHLGVSKDQKNLTSLYYLDTQFRFVYYPYGGNGDRVIGVAPGGSTPPGHYKDYLIMPAVYIEDSSSYLAFKYDVTGDSTSPYRLCVSYTEDCGWNWEDLVCYEGDGVNGWRRDTVNLSSLVGKTVQLALKFELKVPPYTYSSAIFADSITLHLPRYDVSVASIEDLSKGWCWNSSDSLYVQVRNVGNVPIRDDSIDVELWVRNDVYKWHGDSVELEVGDTLTVPFYVTIGKDTVNYGYSVRSIVRWDQDEESGNDTLYGTLYQKDPMRIVSTDLVAQDSFATDSVYVSVPVVGYKEGVLWYVNGVLVLQAGSGYLYLPDTTEYYELKMVTWACGDTIVLTDILYPVGIDEGRSGWSWIELYPNPARSDVWVFWRGEGFKGGEIRVLDMQGRVLLKEEMRSPRMRLDISSLAKGCYYVEVSSFDGRIERKPIIRVE